MSESERKSVEYTQQMLDTLSAINKSWAYHMAAGWSPDSKKAIDPPEDEADPPTIVEK